MTEPERPKDDEISLLAWSGYQDDTFKRLLGEAYRARCGRGLDLRVTKYIGGDELLNILESGTHPDLLIADYELLRTLRDREYIRAFALPPGDISDHYFPGCGTTSPSTATACSASCPSPAGQGVEDRQDGRDAEADEWLPGGAGSGQGVGGDPGEGAPPFGGEEVR